MINDDDYKRAKEAFVADLHGTTAQEVFMVFAVMPVCACAFECASVHSKMRSVWCVWRGKLAAVVNTSLASWLTVGDAMAVLGSHAAARGRGLAASRLGVFREYTLAHDTTVHVPPSRWKVSRTECCVLLILGRAC